MQSSDNMNIIATKKEENKKWNEDISRLREQNEILECILKNRLL